MAVPLTLRILTKHLDDAESALERFDAGLSSPTMTLVSLARTAEESFLANVDGLVVGGALAVDELLLPAIEGRKPPAERRVTAIVVALLKGGRAALVVRALAHPAPSVRRAAVRGCALAAGASLDDWIRQSLDSGASPAPRPTLVELAAERGLLFGTLEASLRSVEVAEVVAALRVAHRSDARAHEASVVASMGHAEAAVRDAAMVAALHLGLDPGWSTCRSLAFDGRVAHPLALALVGGLGDRPQHRMIAELLSRESHRVAALRALGVSGNVEMVPALLGAVRAEDPATAAAARDALGTLLGTEVDEHLEEDATGATLAEWWGASRGAFAAQRRYVAGVVADRAGYARALEVLPTSRRFLLALLVSIQTGGASRVPTRGLTATQRAEMARIAAPGAAGWVRSFSYF